MITCSCGYQTEDEINFLAHLIACPNEPETKWGTYADVIGPTKIPFKNSEILEEETK